MASKYIRQFLGAEEFINKLDRYCLWLVESTSEDRQASEEITRRLQGVSAMREASSKAATQKLAEVPHLFGEIRQTKSNYLLTPRVSSENRRYVPIGYMDADVIASDAVFMLPNATLYEFGMLCSTMHNAWMRTVCGRLKSDYRYSNTIVYNNYPWPKAPSAEARKAVEVAAQSVLNARSQYTSKSLAWLYNSDTMPAPLRDAHDTLDEAVDDAYGYMGRDDDADRVAYLFERYRELTTVLPALDDEVAEKTTPASKLRKSKAKKT